MSDPGVPAPQGEVQAAPVSRARYLRERAAREEAERLLEAKSRELFEANENLDQLVRARTARLREALRAAETAIAMRTRFLAVMSHEIRTPLGGVMGMLELLQAGELPPEAQDAISTARQSADALKRIVDDVLDLASLDAGKMRFESEPVDLRAVARGVFGLLEARAAAKRLTLECAIADGVPAVFLGDSTRIGQLISNFADNAVKFSEQGRIILRADVIVSAAGAADWLRVAIEDEGAGISPADQALLFADFSQLGPTLSRRREGVGLGLSICRRIVEGLNGRIGVESGVGRGSSFWFEIPVQAIADPRESESSASASVERFQGAMADKRILVAEDNPINRKVLGLFLQRLGVLADFAEDGSQAVRAAERSRYDVIVMDVAMPGMDGIAAAKAIRSGNGVSKATPIVALTAHVMGSVAEECRNAGMQDVLTKPISFDALGQALLESLGGRYEQQAMAEGSAGPAGEMGTSKVRSDDMAAGGLDPLVLRDLRSMMAEAEIARLLTEFLTDVANRIAVMQAASARGDSETIRKESHSIRGAAGLVGASSILELAATLEDDADSLDAEDVGVLLDEMRMAKRRLRLQAAGMTSPEAKS